MEKMKFTWKRIRKAFYSLDLDKNGYISKENMQLYFSSWGLTPEQFDWLYDKFDQDKDGKISYNDFTQTIGSELFPAETLYFRQAKP
jgi:Ca2+-binding EF-hand superfamily protein